MHHFEHNYLTFQRLKTFQLKALGIIIIFLIFIVELSSCGGGKSISGLTGSVVDWEMRNFGPGNCVHSPGGAKDIRARGVIHNTIHY